MKWFENQYHPKSKMAARWTSWNLLYPQLMPTAAEYLANRLVCITSTMSTVYAQIFAAKIFADQVLKQVLKVSSWGIIFATGSQNKPMKT
jgi:hypothetical protein